MEAQGLLFLIVCCTDCCETVNQKHDMIAILLLLQLNQHETFLKGYTTKAVYLLLISDYIFRSNSKAPEIPMASINY